MADRERKYPDEDVYGDQVRGRQQDNLAVLCHNCHSETMTSAPFARRLDPATVRAYRDGWNAIVRARREADAGASKPSLRDAVIREMRRGRTIAGRIGPYYQPTMRDEIGRWEADVAYIFDSQGRNDLSRRFLWNPPLDRRGALVPLRFRVPRVALLPREMLDLQRVCRF